MAPGLVFSIMFIVVFAGSMFYSQNTGWNLAAIVSPIFRIGCFTWLARRLRRDRREASRPRFQEDQPELPFFLQAPQDRSG